MKSKSPLWTASAAVLLGGLATFGLAESPSVTKPASKLKPEELRAKLTRDESPLPNSGQVLMSYADVAEKIMPSVVRVTASVPMDAGHGRLGGRGGQQVPPQMREFFRRYFGLPEDGLGADDGAEQDDQAQEEEKAPRKRNGPSQKGTGSGVIISTDGYILTNNHVVADADKIEVTVGDESKSYKAIVVGTDPMTDVALIKIDGKDLPAATLADSKKLRVGDIVLAAGSPMELSQTLTQGIVSAVGRTGMHIVGRGAGIEDFIQTDAAINPGNSGGPLVDGKGRVVGINTAIMTQSGMSAGIGFSIPINMAMRVAEDLADDGKVTRGFLGVAMDNLSEADAKALGLGESGGVLIKSVVPGQPAEKAGVEAGDVVVGIGGHRVDNSSDLRSVVASARAGEEVELEVLRDGKRSKLKAMLAGATDEQIQNRSMPAIGKGPAANSKAPERFIRGLTLQAVTDGLRDRYDIKKGVEGLVVVMIEPNTPGAASGLEEGDIITSIDNEPVKTMADAKRLAAQAEEGVYGVRFQRKGQKMFVVVREDGKSE